MAYRNILVAVDLSPDSQILVHKAVSLAERDGAKIYFIHVDVNYADIYSSLVEEDLGPEQERIEKENRQLVQSFIDAAGYPISATLYGKGDFIQALENAVVKYDIDLIVCGHYQDFWNTLKSAARQLIHRMHIDMLIVPLSKDNDEYFEED
ncbi:universal stress protein [Franconibacter daqui]|uniref:universal stress protein n=1 Tax=Franconibacter daqui TaxID=2047724 RepID=UPI002DB90943|nr:universal stress protein [Franconibacter daqui]MEB5920587.1 universal stress protein [Franconibacter daqui]